MGLAVPRQLAADPFVGLGQRAGAKHHGVAAHHRQVRVAADHRQGQPARLGQQRAVVRQALGRGVGEAEIEDEVRRPEPVDPAIVHAVEHARVALRAEVEIAAPETRVPRIGARRQRRERQVAGGDDGVVAVGRNTDGVQEGGDRRGGARCVGQQDHPLAGGPEPVHAVDGARVGGDPVVHQAPQIEDKAVVALGQRRESSVIWDRRRLGHRAALYQMSVIATFGISQWRAANQSPAVRNSARPASCGFGCSPLASRCAFAPQYGALDIPQVFDCPRRQPGRRLARRGDNRSEVVDRLRSGIGPTNMV